MHRRNFLALSTAAAAAPGFAFQVEKSKMKITSVQLVQTRPKHPLPAYKPSPDAWSTGGVEVASPMSIYPEYKAMRSLFLPDPGKVPGFTVEIATDKGVKGYGSGGPGGGHNRSRASAQAADRARIRSMWSATGISCGAPPCPTGGPASR